MVLVAFSVAFAHDSLADSPQPPSPAASESADGSSPETKKVNIPSVDNSNYIGDCLRFVGAPNSKIIGGVHYKVVNQVKDGGATSLQLAEANWHNSLIPCSVKDAGKRPVTLTSEELAHSPYYRTGWVYGLLALPFKYYPSDQSVGTNVSIGPYIGRRIDEIGDGLIVAASIGLTSVKANSLGADGKVVINGSGEPGTVQATGITMSGGLIFNLYKNVKPFQIGVFVGTDRISSSPTVLYSQNKKAWIAFQIGYNFTDN